jgi:diaminopimelate decarboxylase
MSLQPSFGHPAGVFRFWRRLVVPWLGRQPTPFYLFSAAPVEAALKALDASLGSHEVRHWFSCKTQPLGPLLRWWRARQRSIEVVSEFELQAALAAGFRPNRILVNGPAKDRWLPRRALPGLLVNFDSAREAAALGPLARQLAWTTGLRLSTAEEFDPEVPDYPTQFGMGADEAGQALRALAQCQVKPEIVHMHLRTNVASPRVYQRALTEMADLCRDLGFTPRYVDCGGGIPPAHVLTRDGRRLDAEFDLAELARVYQRALRRFPGKPELWLENGRYLTAASGVLVVRIIEAKERRGMRHLVCDGGRTGQALVSNWEAHELMSIASSSGSTGRDRAGGACLTTVTGPTCMAFDQLARRMLPRTLQPGDHLVWLEAGAYHLSWETRFSHGLAAVLWHDGRRTRRVRAGEEFPSWWAQLTGA